MAVTVAIINVQAMQISLLLQKINQGLPTEVRKRYEELNDKLHKETITPEEHQEFLQLVDRLELADAERLRHLIELADIRNVTVDTLVSQLDIRRPAYVRTESFAAPRDARRL